MDKPRSTCSAKACLLAVGGENRVLLKDASIPKSPRICASIFNQLAKVRSLGRVGSGFCQGLPQNQAVLKLDLFLGWENRTPAKKICFAWVSGKQRGPTKKKIKKEKGELILVGRFEAHVWHPGLCGRNPEGDATGRLTHLALDAGFCNLVEKQGRFPRQACGPIQNNMF